MLHNKMKQSALTSSRGLAPPKTAFLHREPENVSMFDTQIYTYRQGVSLVNNLEKRMSEKKASANNYEWNPMVPYSTILDV